MTPRLRTTDLRFLNQFPKSLEKTMASVNAVTFLEAALQSSPYSIFVMAEGGLG